MTKQTRFARFSLLLVAAALVALALAACSQQPASSSSASASSAASAASASASASASTTTASASGAADVVTIGLDYNAGTGFEWEYAIEPEGVVELVDRATEDHAKDEAITGGPLSEVFTLRAQKPGEATVTFNLVRSWEGEPAETQVYAFTVSNDLKMVLNPYKSNFNNEPTWETA